MNTELQTLGISGPPPKCPLIESLWSLITSLEGSWGSKSNLRVEVWGLGHNTTSTKNAIGHPDATTPTQKILMLNPKPHQVARWCILRPKSA